MKGKGVLVISLIFNIVLIALLMFVKKESTAAAKAKVDDFNAKVKSTVALIKESKVNNNVLWEIAIEASGGAGTVQSVKKVISEAKFPAAKDGEDLPVTLKETETDKGLEITAGWEKYSIKFSFDKKGKLIDTDVSSLKGTETMLVKDKKTNNWSLAE